MKKLVTFLFVAMSTVTAHAVDKIYNVYDFSGGLLDIYSAERMPDKFSPYMANVKLDEDMGITVKTGSVKDNTTSLGNTPITSLYTYRKNDGTHYLIAQSSYSIYYSKGNGFYTLIKDTFTTADAMTYATALDNLYGGNGTDNEWYFDGSAITDFTVANSTSMVKARYHCWFKNHLFRAGVNGTLSTLYYSALQDPGDNEGGIFVSQDDGDKITGMFPSATGDYLIITKQFSTWGLYGSGPDDWTLKCINPSIGCLYGSTFDYLNGGSVWVSDRGVEFFDGTTFTLLSQNIDNQIKSLKQLNVTSNFVEKYSNWEDGTSLVNLDTTTYRNSVSLANNDILQTESDTAQEGVSSIFYETYQHNLRLIRQSIRPPISINVKRIDIKNPGVQTEGNVKISVRDSNMNVMVEVSTRVQSTSVYNFCTYISMDTPLTLRGGSTYYIVIATDTNNVACYWQGSTTDVYKGGRLEFSSDSIHWAPSNAVYMPAADLAFRLITVSSGSYASDVMYAKDWRAWDTVAIKDYQPEGSSIEYFVKTSTAADNMATKSAIPITNYGYIASLTGPYIQFIASMTQTEVGNVPNFSAVTFNYYTTEFTYPVAKSYDSAYYISVSTETDGKNNIVYRFDKAGVWEMFNDAGASSMAIYRGKLYYGSPLSDGFIYRQKVANIFSHNGIPYKSIYQTKMYDFGNPIQDKYIKSIYVTTKSRDNDINLSYRLDGGSGDWETTTFSIAATNDRIVTQKINFPHALRSKYIQFQFDSMDYFNIRGFSIVYEELPLQ